MSVSHLFKPYSKPNRGILLSPSSRRRKHELYHLPNEITQSARARYRTLAVQLYHMGTSAGQVFCISFGRGWTGTHSSQTCQVTQQTHGSTKMWALHPVLLPQARLDLSHVSILGRFMGSDLLPLHLGSLLSHFPTATLPCLPRIGTQLPRRPPISPLYWRGLISRTDHVVTGSKQCVWETQTLPPS